MKLNPYQRMMLYMTARILEILRAHYNVTDLNSCDDTDHIRSAINGSAAGEFLENWEDQICQDR